MPIFDLGKHYGQETVSNKADIAVLRLNFLLRLTVTG
jgi:hypothetical protein